jgi:hypothetical protein
MQQQQTKMTLPDAIGLITLRLGRVETIVQHLQTDLPTGDYSGGGGGGGGSGGGGDLPDNMRVVDEAVFSSIVARLDQLETGHKQLAVKVMQKAVSVTAATVPVPTTVPVQLQDNRVTQINENVETLQAEIAQIKDLLLKLQSFTMETNQKLSDIIFTDKQEVDNGDDDNDDGRINICSEDASDHNTQMMNLMQMLSGGRNGGRGGFVGGGMGMMNVSGLSGDDGSNELNLKEYIQSELSSGSALKEEIVVEELSEE